MVRILPVIAFQTVVLSSKQYIVKKYGKTNTLRPIENTLKNVLHLFNVALRMRENGKSSHMQRNQERTYS